MNIAKMNKKAFSDRDMIYLVIVILMVVLGYVIMRAVFKG